MKTKICSACGLDKPLSDFHKCGGRRRANCKSCTLEKARLYLKTPQGKAACAWNGIYGRAENRDGEHPTYATIELRMTRDEFMAWAVPAYEQWVSCGNSIESGTVDRLENLGHYEIGNLRIATRATQNVNQNRNKNVLAPTGQLWCKPCGCYKPRDDFAKDRASSTGRQARCRKCRYRENKARRKILASK